MNAIACLEADVQLASEGQYLGWRAEQLFTTFEVREVVY